MKAALYVRTSTADQTTENQERELRAVAARLGHEIVEVYADNGISGAKGRDRRPAFDRLCRDVTRRRFDIIMVWSVDRLGRSLQDLVGFLSEIHASRVELYLHQQGLDTTTPAGRAMFQMMGVFAEFERAMIVERVGRRDGACQASGHEERQGDRSSINARGRSRSPSSRRIAQAASVYVGWPSSSALPTRRCDALVWWRLNPLSPCELRGFGSIIFHYG